MLFYGVDFYGPVDRVPEVFEVVTEFGHVYLIPFLPYRSFVVRRLPSGKREGARVRLRWKSIFYAWFRATLFMVIVGSIPATFLAWVWAQSDADMRSRTTNEEQEISDVWTIPICVGLTAWGLYFATHLIPSIRNAHFERAVELGKTLGLTEVEWSKLEKHFGRLRPRDAIAGAGKGTTRPLRAEMDVDVSI